MHYRPEIDGLRAVAVIPVILFHAGFSGFGGGFIGVDVFFVISGYLITSIILADQAAGRFSIARFYERRARRILPALFLVMLACLPFAWLYLQPQELAAFGKSVAAVATFSSNVFFWSGSGYFAAAAETKPLLHTWSLAVEEQFYVLFPLLLMLTARLARTSVAALLTVCATASLVLAEFGARNYPSAAFFLLPTRGWELLIGALLCYVRIAPPRWIGEAAGLVGLSLILASVVLLTKTSVFPGLSALPATAGTALVILFATQNTLTGRLLGLLSAIGLVSYSAYLWHHPLFVFARMAGEPGPTIFALLVLLTFILAYLSWRFVEQPFRRGATVGRGAIAGFAVGGIILFTGAGLLVARHKGFEDYYYAHRLNAGEQRVYELVKTHTQYDISTVMGDDGKCNFWGETVDEAFERRFAACAALHGKALVVLGDSHAMNIYNALYRAKTAAFVVGVSRGGCRPHDSLPYCHYQAFEAFADRQKDAIGTIAFHQSGSYLLHDHLGNAGSSETFIKDKGYNIHREAIARLTAWLQRLQAKHALVWLGPFVEAGTDMTNVRALAKAGLKVNPVSIAVFAALDAELKASARTAGIVYVSLVDALGITESSMMAGDCLMYRDTDHFSICGETIIGPKIGRALAATP